MKKSIKGKFVDPSIPGIAWQMANWERNQATLDAENGRQARLHAEIMRMAPLVKRSGGVFNG